jgi:hypothetical protein
MIYRQIKSQSDCLELQEDLEAAIKWEQDWLMSFHPPDVTGIFDDVIFSKSTV